MRKPTEAAGPSDAAREGVVRQAEWAAAVWRASKAGYGPSGDRRLSSGLGRKWPHGKTMGRGSSRPSGRKEEGGGILFFFQLLFKAILKARIQIKFKLEFKSNHSKN